MWFKRKTKNRRFERAHVLDVKLRSSQVRAARMRLGAVVFGVLSGTMFGLYLLWRLGDWALDRLVYENESFAIQRVDVRTDGVIPTNQLRNLSRIKSGQNLIKLDLVQVKRNLELESRIQSVSVERILPRTLCIRVTEREPIAQINQWRPRADGGVECAVFHLDADGFVMLPLDPRQRTVPLGQAIDSLPVIAGLNAADVRLGSQIDAAQVRAALQLIQKFNDSPMAELVDLKRVDTSSPEVLVVTTGQGSEITFGIQDVDRQLRRWQKIREAALKINKVIAALDLSVGANIPIRLQAASALPPANPKNLKPQRTRKKNV
jgi:cell division protein FtsQ